MTDGAEGSYREFEQARPAGYEGRFTGATIRKDESGRVFYQAELQDLATLRSVRICKLEDISPVERKE